MLGDLCFYIITQFVLFLIWMPRIFYSLRFIFYRKSTIFAPRETKKPI